MANKTEFRSRSEPPFDSDEEFEALPVEADEQYSSSWEDAVVSDPTSNSENEVIFQRKNISPEFTYGESLITNMFRGNNGLSTPIDIPTEPRRQRCPSPVLSPRSTRRQMLAEELTRSLRQHLLWEHHAKSQLRSLYDEAKLRHDDRGDHSEVRELSGSV